MQQTKATDAARKKRRSSEEIMGRLISAAKEEFKRCGFAGATTAAIARNAEVKNIREQARLYITELQQFIGEHSKLLLSLVVAQAYAGGNTQGVGEIDSLRTYFERGAAMMTSRVVDPQVDPSLQAPDRDRERRQTQ